MLFDIEWYGDGQYANQFPELIMFSDDPMSMFEDHLYVSYGFEDGTLYYSDNHPFLVNFCYHTPANENGYGGRLFHLNMVDGSVVTVKGPWSSGNYFTNTVVSTQSIEGYYVDNKGVKYRGDFKVDFVQSLIDDGVIDATIIKYVPNYDGLSYQLLPAGMKIEDINGLSRVIKEIL